MIIYICDSIYIYIHIITYIYIHILYVLWYISISVYMFRIWHIPTMPLSPTGIVSGGIVSGGLAECKDGVQ